MGLLRVSDSGGTRNISQKIYHTNWNLYKIKVLFETLACEYISVAHICIAQLLTAAVEWFMKTVADCETSAALSNEHEKWGIPKTNTE